MTKRKKDVKKIIFINGSPRQNGNTRLLASIASHAAQIKKQVLILDILTPS